MERIIVKIFINPGHAPHGNPDPGAVNKAGIRECDIVLQIGEKLKYRLEALGHTVMLFQDNLPYKIIEESKKWHSEIFISLHCGYSWRKEDTGTRILYYGKRPERLIKNIQNELKTTVKYSCNTTEEVNKYVLISLLCPAVMVELGFISNCEDLKILQKKQDSIVQALARGIIKSF